MTFDQYEQWFWHNHRNLKIPADVTVQHGPDLRPPQLGFWRMNWYLMWGTNFYAKVREEFTPRKAGGSQRNSFSFHYGPLPAKPDARGLPAYFHTDPVVLRICLAMGFPHLHFKNPLPHIGQDGIKGSLIIKDVDLFDFLRAVFKHRETGQELNTILGFEVL